MILCIDFASKKIKIAGFKREKGSLKLIESLELSTSDPEAAFGEYLNRISKEIDEIRVSGALESTFHRIFTIPDLKKKVFTQALEAEVTKAFGKEHQFKYRDLGEVPGPGNKINRKIMTAGIKRSALEALSQMFADSPIKPSMFTTYPASLHALARKLQLLTQEPLAFLELDSPTTRIVIFKEDEIRVAREVNVIPEEKDPDRSALAKDIYRTLLFYTETYPNEMVTRLVLAGNSSSSKTANILAEKTGAEIVPFSPETIAQTEGETQDVPPACLSLALLDPGHFDFAFVPLSVQRKTKIRKTVTLSFSVTLGIILILALAVSRLSMNLKNLNVYQGGIQGEIRMKEDRLKELGLEFVSHSIETSQPPWSEILLETAAVAPSGVVFESFVLKKLKNRWQGEIVGLADGSDEISSLLLVEKVQNNFNKSPLFTQVRLVEKELQGHKVEFKIGYQLDM